MNQRKQRTHTAFPSVDRRAIWIGLGLFTLLLGYLFRLNPNFTEVVYSRGFFPVFRWIWDYTFGLIPFPLLYLLIPTLLYVLIRKSRKAYVNYQKVAWRYRLGSALFSLFAFISAVLFFFQLIWGFNYYRVPVEKQLKLPPITPDSTTLHQEVLRIGQEAQNVRAQIPGATTEALDTQHVPDKLEATVRGLLQHKLKQLQYPTPGRVRGRILKPRGSLMRMGATGIYIPFVGEGHIDGGLAPVSHPFTLTHELVHGYGIGNEGSCNFFAYLALHEAEDPFIRYGALLAYWRYLARELYRYDPELLAPLRENLDPGMRNDLRSIQEAYKKYPTFFPNTNRKVYNAYLKSQGVSEGIRSYSRLVELIFAWKEKEAAGS